MIYGFFTSHNIHALLIVMIAYFAVHFVAAAWMLWYKGHRAAEEEETKSPAFAKTAFRLPIESICLYVTAGTSAISCVLLGAAFVTGTKALMFATILLHTAPVFFAFGANVACDVIQFSAATADVSESFSTATVVTPVVHYYTSDDVEQQRPPPQLQVRPATPWAAASVVPAFAG